MTDDGIGHAEDASPAFDSAFDSASITLSGSADTARSHGDTRLRNLDQWKTEPDAADVELFVEPCTGPTLDVGCGPGRLAAELTARQVMAVGIDTAQDAVRLARQRGAEAVQRDVFADVPGEPHWEHVLLADGNIGIGGDPVSLLVRIRELMEPYGEIIVEVSESGSGVRYELHRLQIGDRVTAPFPWAVVGLDAVEGVAARAGLRVHMVRSAGDRHVVTLVSE